VGVGQAGDLPPRRVSYAPTALGRQRATRRLRAFRCRTRYRRNEDGDSYASRLACANCGVVVRFYGMV
jgi:hypothetical protein